MRINFSLLFPWFFVELNCIQMFGAQFSFTLYWIKVLFQMWDGDTLGKSQFCFLMFQNHWKAKSVDGYVAFMIRQHDYNNWKRPAINMDLIMFFIISLSQYMQMTYMLFKREKTDIPRCINIHIPGPKQTYNHLGYNHRMYTCIQNYGISVYQLCKAWSWHVCIPEVCICIFF